MDGLFVQRPGGIQDRSVSNGRASGPTSFRPPPPRTLGRDVAQEIFEEVRRDIVFDEAPGAEHISPDERRWRSSASEGDGADSDAGCSTARSTASSRRSSPAPPAIDGLFAKRRDMVPPPRPAPMAPPLPDGGDFFDGSFARLASGALPDGAGGHATAASRGVAHATGANLADAIFARPAPRRNDVWGKDADDIDGSNGGAPNSWDGVFVGAADGFGASPAKGRTAIDNLFARPGSTGSLGSDDSEDDPEEDMEQDDAEKGGGRSVEGADAVRANWQQSERVRRCAADLRRAMLTRWALLALGVALLVALLTASLATGCDEDAALGRFCVAAGPGQLVLAVTPAVVVLLVVAWYARRSFERRRKCAEEAWRHDGGAQRGALEVLEALAEAPETERLKYVRQVVQIMKDFPAKGVIQHRGCAALERTCRAQKGNPSKVKSAGAVPVVLAALEAHARVRSVQRSGLAALSCLARVGASQVFELGGVSVVIASMAKFKRDRAVQLSGCLTLGGVSVGSANCRRSVTKYGGADLLLRTMARHLDHADVVIAASEAMALLLKHEAGLSKELLHALPLVQDMITKVEEDPPPAGTAEDVAKRGHEREAALRSLRKAEALLRGVKHDAGADAGDALPSKACGAGPRGRGAVLGGGGVGHRGRAGAGAGHGEVDSDAESDAGTPRQDAGKIADQQARELHDRFKQWGNRKKASR